MASPLQAKDMAEATSSNSVSEVPTHSLAQARGKVWASSGMALTCCIYLFYWYFAGARSLQSTGTSAPGRIYTEKRARNVSTGAVPEDGGSFSALLTHNETWCALIRRSTLYSEACNNTGDKPPRPMLVTATGRSGTLYLATLLQKIGIKVSHDNGKVTNGFQQGAVSWPHAFNAWHCGHPSFTFWRRLAEKRPQQFFRHVFHLVREPLASINSRWNDGDIRPFKNVSACQTTSGEEHRGEVRIKSKRNRTLLETVRHWVLWHSFLASVAEWRLRVEDVSSSVILRLLQRAGLRAPGSANRLIKRTIAELGRTTNTGHTKKKRPLTWAMIAELDATWAAMAQALALLFGYEVPSSVLALGGAARQGIHCGFRSADARWSCELAAPR